MKRLRHFHSNAVWPRLWLVAVFAAAYALLDSAIWLIERSVPGFSGDVSTMPEFAIFRSIVLSTGAVMYAVFRLVRFHPVCDRAYAEWLKLTPWTAAKPLPLGPLHIVWQDAVVDGAMAAVAHWHAHLSPLIPVVAFGFVYLAGMTLLLALTRQRTACVILGFLWPALLLPYPNDLPRFVLLSAIVAVNGFGYRRSLGAFPWNGRFLSLQSMNLNIDFGQGKYLQALSVLGWPFGALSPKLEFRAVSTFRGLIVSTLLGWWAYCIIAGSRCPPVPELLLVVASFAALARLGIYCTRITTPFTVWGRIITGRLLLPGFDQVLVIPLITILLAVGGGVAIKRSGSWFPVTEACVISILAFVLLGGGPTLRRWHLTGQFRFTPLRTTAANRRALRQL